MQINNCETCGTHWPRPSQPNPLAPALLRPRPMLSNLQFSEVHHNAWLQHNAWCTATPTCGDARGGSCSFVPIAPARKGPPHNQHELTRAQQQPPQGAINLHFVCTFDVHWSTFAYLAYTGRASTFHIARAAPHRSVPPSFSLHCRLCAKPAFRFIGLTTVRSRMRAQPWSTAAHLASPDAIQPMDPARPAQLLSPGRPLERRPPPLPAVANLPGQVLLCRGTSGTSMHRMLGYCTLDRHMHPPPTRSCSPQPQPRCE